MDDRFVDTHSAFGEVDIQFGNADHRRFAELPGHEGGVAGSAAAAGQYAFGGQHAVDVVRLGFRPHHDDRLAVLFGPGFGQVGVEGHDAASRTGRHIESVGEILAFSAGSPCGFGIELGVHEKIHLLRRHAQHGLLATDQPFLDHVDGDPHRSLGGALAIARLQHPEFPVLDGELDILHFAIVLFELSGDLFKLL